MTQDLSGVTVAIVTVSDEVPQGGARELNGAVIADALYDLGANIIGAIVPPDAVAETIPAAIAEGARAVITVGGTGIGSRDMAPDATRPLLTHELPGIAERLRATDAYANPEAALSRGVAGVTAQGAIVVNVADSQAAAKAAAVVLGAVLPPAFEQLAA